MKNVKLFEEFLNEARSFKNKGLTTLVGLEYEGGDFNCSHNKLTSLEGAPQKVSGDFDCSYNRQLTSLEGSPREVEGSFDCSYNPKLTSLKGSPDIVKGKVFFCIANKLTSLEGAPRVVNTFNCNNNELTSLQGAPREVKGHFFCIANKLTSLEGAPEKVDLYFDCSYNPLLLSLKGAPQARKYIFDVIRINPQEVELHKTDLEIFKKWLASGLEIDEFLRTSGTKYRGRITGKKFGI